MREQLNRSEDHTGGVDRDTRILIDKIGIATSFVLMALAIVGEILGWWNDLGLLIGGASLLVGLLSLLDVSGIRLLDGIVSLAGGQRVMLANQRLMVGNQETMIGNQQAMLDRQDATVLRLDRIAEILDERLPS